MMKYELYEVITRISPSQYIFTSAFLPLRQLSRYFAEQEEWDGQEHGAITQLRISGRPLWLPLAEIEMWKQNFLWESICVVKMGLSGLKQDREEYKVNTVFSYPPDPSLDSKAGMINQQDRRIKGDGAEV